MEDPVDINHSWFGDSLGKILVANGYFEEKFARFGLFVLKTNNTERVNRLNQ